MDVAKFGNVPNNGGYRFAGRQQGGETGRTRLHRPQTNGKIERVHRTLNAGWAFSSSTSARRPAGRESLPAHPHE